MKQNNTTQPVFAEESIAQKIEKITQGLVGRIGVAAQELSSGLNVSINGDETFAMASAYKVAIATTVLDRVDKGELSLDQLVEVPHDMYGRRRNRDCRDDSPTLGSSSRWRT